MCTNAARHRIAVGDNIKLLEFGLRRAQGPDGGLSASRYCYMGGFDATSNVLAGQIFGIPLKGTHAHAYVTSFVKSDGDRQPLVVPHSDGVSESCTDFMSLVRKHAGTVFKLCGECGFVVDPNEVRAQSRLVLPPCPLSHTILTHPFAFKLHIQRIAPRWSVGYPF